MAGPGSKFITFAVVAVGVIAAGVGLAFAHRRGKHRKRSTRQPSGGSSKLQGEAPSPISAEREVEDDRASAATAGDQLLPDQEVDGRFLTVQGVREDLLQEDGGTTEGGFGTVIFLTSKSKPSDKFALKKAKDTPAGRRQMRQEAMFFARLRHLPPLDNVVRLADVIVAPTPMILMYREESTLADMLEDDGNAKIADVARVLDGALSGVEALHGAGFFHRDIKPDNILISTDGRGVLVDFGLHLTTSEALGGHGLGDGTPEYSAPETELQGWSLQAETYSIFVCFSEAVLGRSLFGGEELLHVKEDRVADLMAAHEDSVEDVEYFREEVSRAMTAMGDEAETQEELLNEYEEELASASDRMEKSRIQLWRLELDVGSWVPGEAALAELTRMGPPLAFFVSSEKGSEDDQDVRSTPRAACREAKAQPGKLFEEGWPNWLPSSSKADLKEEVHRTMEFVIGAGVLAPNPGARPPTVGSARKVLMAATATYEEGNT